MMKLNWKTITLAAFLFVGVPMLSIVGSDRGLQPGDAYALSTGDSPVGTNRITEVVKTQDKAVVGVHSSVKMEKMRGMDPQNPFGGSPFGRGTPMPNPIPRGSGSGFIIDNEGHVLTNNHVVDGADQVKIQLHDGKEYEAEVIGKDPATDIALLKIVRKEGDTTPLPHMKLGDSEKLEVGEWVIAIGNPFGLNHTVTTGIVSAKGRNLGSGPYDAFIQTDASINPGNSGGPLLNMSGDVVGINTMILSGNGGNVGIGFAIPINMAKSIVADLKKDGKVTRGWLGVTIQKMTEELASSFGLSEPKGVLVNGVLPKGPAERGGLKRGDVIVKYDGQDLVDFSALPRMVGSTEPGKTVTLDVLRDGKPVAVKITIEKMQESQA
ncbi:S1C family serine protease [Nitrospina gracilis]|uniref:S1C family serine protease n=1 Tax=Nitrospina gracilis TaxID=35801 RepID=UPI001EFFCE38|nr:Do family serine endopeptidase [Nitrospina gracilis]MCF8720363.1 serine protease Do [Nitrospina gracilis Nb-211]